MESLGQLGQRDGVDERRPELGQLALVVPREPPEEVLADDQLQDRVPEVLEPFVVVTGTARLATLIVPRRMGHRLAEQGRAPEVDLEALRELVEATLLLGRQLRLVEELRGLGRSRLGVPPVRRDRLVVDQNGLGPLRDADQAHGAPPCGAARGRGGRLRGSRQGHGAGRRRSSPRAAARPGATPPRRLPLRGWGGLRLDRSRPTRDGRHAGGVPGCDGRRAESGRTGCGRVSGTRHQRLGGSGHRPRPAGARAPPSRRFRRLRLGLAHPGRFDPRLGEIGCRSRGGRGFRGHLGRDRDRGPLRGRRRSRGRGRGAGGLPGAGPATACRGSLSAGRGRRASRLRFGAGAAALGDRGARGRGTGRAVHALARRPGGGRDAVRRQRAGRGRGARRGDGARSG